MNFNYIDEFRKASNYHINGNLTQAKIIYEKILKQNPDHADTLNMLGVLFYQKKNYDRAINLIKKSISINSYSPPYYNNLGNIYKEIGEYNEAISCYNKVLNLQSDHFGAYNNLGIIYKKLNNFKQSIIFYKKALGINPAYLDCYINLGHVQISLKKIHEALNSFNQVINIEPNNYKAFHGRGIVYLHLKKFNHALNDLNKAISLNDKFVEGYNDRGVLFFNTKKYQESIKDFKKALELKDDLNGLLGNYFNTAMKVCHWSEFKTFLTKMVKYANNNIDVCSPFVFLGLIDDPYLQKKITNTYTKNNFSIKSFDKNSFIYKKKEKIILGYYSPDFRDHPVSYLIHEVLDNHDRKKFELYGFYCGPKLNSKNEMHNKIKKNFNKMYDINDLDDVQVAELSRKIGVDIAIDLAGHTQYSRTGIFLQGCAPIQVNYLGYPGTMCIDGIDYLIADKNIISEDQLDTVTEKTIYIDCYQANEKIQKNTSTNLSKNKLNLPEDKFIFCCFNSTWKITPDVFDIWVKILKAAPNSVLWLLKQDDLIVNNLIKESLNRGLDPNRLIFAERLPRNKHIERQSFADLFLDTYPYGAHTTCSDSIRSNLPVLTISGNSFPSKVSSSIIKKLNLDELIAKSFDEYFKKAINFANNPALLKEIKIRMKKEISFSDLFNPEYRARVLENAYEKIYYDYFKKDK